MSIKGSNKEVADVLFSNMSSKMADTIKSELEYTRNVRLRDVEEAQQRIVSVIRRLEEEGELVIAKSGKDDIIV
jgi:flagellar motor switch protein FliG